MALFRANLLVIQHLETLFLGGNHVKVMCERVWRKAQECALNRASWLDLAASKSPKGGTRVKYVGELKSHTSQSTTGQNFQSGQAVSPRLKLLTQSSREANSPKHYVWEKLTFRIPNTHQYKYPWSHVL